MSFEKFMSDMQQYETNVVARLETPEEEEVIPLHEQELRIVVDELQEAQQQNQQMHAQLRMTQNVANAQRAQINQINEVRRQEARKNIRKKRILATLGVVGFTAALVAISRR